MSIKLRFWISSLVIIITISLFCGALYRDIQSAQNLLLTVEKTAEVRSEIELFLADIKDAETGERGYIITGNEDYLASYTTATLEFPQHLIKLRASIADDPNLQRQIEFIALLAKVKMEELDKIIRIRRDHGFDEAVKAVMTGHEKNTMDDIRRSVANVNDNLEESLASQRAQSEKARATLRQTMFVSLPLVLLVVSLAFVFAASSIRRQLRHLTEGIARIRSGDLTRVLSIDSEDEIGVIASAFNEMADKLNNEQTQREIVSVELQKIDVDLRHRSLELEARTKTIDLLARMTHRLPGCVNEAEFAGVVECFAPQILDGIPGALYIMSSSHTVLRALAVWKDPKAYTPEFTPADCWGLRRGQPHLIGNTETDVVCNHIDRAKIDGYQCLPLIAQDETLGLLYLEASPAEAQADPDLTPQVLAETIAMALLNMRLRENLRKQSIRDVLTGLFNRRYLEETLDIDFARAARTNSPLSIVMLDVDHFKMFNDNHGHQAGDLVLTEVGKILASFTRKGDIACRYGGEEFILVLTGATAEEARKRAEFISSAMREIKIEHRGRSLETVTLSSGIATYPVHGSEPKDVIAAADLALYAAKKAGRNRTEVALPPHPLDQSAA